MDIFAHTLWAGAGVMLAHRRWPVSPTTAMATVGLAALPDIAHLAPLVSWTLFGDGTLKTLWTYSVALVGQEWHSTT